MKCTTTLSLALWLGAPMLPGGCTDESSHDQHQHAADVHSQDESGEEHADVVQLTNEQLAASGVRLAPLAGGVIKTHISLPAEVGLNEDAVAHLTPRAAGIVAQVHGYLGQEVAPGAVLAIIDSPALGEARIAYLQAAQARSIADAELDRRRTISANTETLLDILREQPELDALRTRAAELRIGENKGQLISAYVKLRAAETNYARERELSGKGLSTQSDLLAAQEAYNSSQAEYLAIFEDIDFSFRTHLLEAQRAASISASAVENAERRLHLLGLSEEQVDRIADEPDINVARYELTAPTAGRIIDKHITPGEKVGDDAAVYTIADLSTVWLNISVYIQYANQIAEGHEVIVRSGERETTGVVDYISAIASEGTRTVTARVVLDNTKRTWKPGEFVTVRIETDEVTADRVVPIDAIQTFEGRQVVFVQDEDGIEPRPVQLGRRNDVNVELLGDDLPLGTPIVVANSFLIKAELGKSAAGHDH